jgi:hypothetical protein
LTFGREADMHEGIYKIEFMTSRGKGTGVAVVYDGWIAGGDNRSYFMGRYSESGGRLTAVVTTGKHSEEDDRPSLFGTDVVTLSLEGHAANGAILMMGHASGHNDLMFSSRLTWLGEPMPHLAKVQHALTGGRALFSRISPGNGKSSA